MEYKIVKITYGDGSIQFGIKKDGKDMMKATSRVSQTRRLFDSFDEANEWLDSHIKGIKRSEVVDEEDVVTISVTPSNSIINS